MDSPPMHGMIKIVAFAGLLFIVSFVGFAFMPPGFSGVPWSLAVVLVQVTISLIMGIILPLGSSILVVTLYWLSEVAVNLYTTALGGPNGVAVITAFSAALLAFPLLIHVGKCLLTFLNRTVGPTDSATHQGERESRDTEREF